MELILQGMLPLINDKWHKVFHFGSADQKLDFTTIPDVAAYTAAVAADDKPTPKYLRIAGDSVSPKDLADISTRLRGAQYTTMSFGSVGFLNVFISVLKFVIGGEKTKIFPPWQGMQYLSNMVSGDGQLKPLDNDRYLELKWTTIESGLRKAEAEKGIKTKST